jgi:hypothetical protein
VKDCGVVAEVHVFWYPAAEFARQYDNENDLYDQGRARPSRLRACRPHARLLWLQARRNNQSPTFVDLAAVGS